MEQSEESEQSGDVALPTELIEPLRAGLPSVAQLALTAITGEVPEYARTLDSEVGRNIEAAIVAALATFLHLLDPRRGPGHTDAALEAARAGAYDLGRGEARTGRTAEALLAAYRIGARVSWREMSSIVVVRGTPAPVVAHFAELVFAYVDELSAASVAGHGDELAASGRLRQQRRDELGRALLTGAPTATLIDLADEAGWQPPKTLTAVLLPAAQAHDAFLRLGSDILSVAADALGQAVPAAHNVLLVPDAVLTRNYLLESAGHDAVVGPVRSWTRVDESLQVALRAHRLLGPSRDGPLDTEQHLGTLVVSADLATLEDLRSKVLAPLEGLTPAARERLTETLRAWLLHLGRRSDVADALHVHPQTVRYRMNQLRDLYGDGLEDPGTVRQLVVALAPVADPAGRYG